MKKKTPNQGGIFEDTMVSLVKDATSKNQNNGLFIMHLLMNCRRVYTDKVEVLSSVVKDNVTLHINEEGFSKLSPTERKEKLYHEMIHVISMHHSRSRNIEDFKLYSMASDLAISHYTKNLDLPRVEDFNGQMEELPDNVVSMKRFKQEKQEEQVGKLAENEVTEYYYEYLKELREKQPQMFSNQGDGNEEGDQEGQQSVSGGSGGESQPQKDKMEINVNGKKLQEDTDQQMWKQSDSNEDYTKQVIQEMVKKAKDSAKGAGTTTSDIDLILNDLFKSEINWISQLRKYCVRRARAGIKRTRRKLNRRTGILNPGKKKEAELKIVYIRDTSGSCFSEEIQNQFCAELDKIHRTGAKITVIDADTEVKRVFEYDRKEVRKLAGCGGTLYAPALIVADEMKPDLIIYAGDGDSADRPEAPRSCPVLWVLTEGREPPCDFGYKINIKVK